MKKRGPNKILNSYTLKELYLDYIKDIEPNSPYYITFKEYGDITGEFYKELSRLLIYESKTIKLPFRLGSLTVIKKKPKTFSPATLNIDWQESKRYHKWIHHINDHTGGFKYRFLWSKKDCRVVNQDLYRMVFSRTNKRELAKAIKSGNHDYLEVKV